MKFRWNHILIVFLFVFGVLYLIGTFLGTTNQFIETWISSSADLWANLFASMFAVLIIEKIIHRAKLQKSKESIIYVKGRLYSALANIIFLSAAPKNWKTNLANPNYNWEPYIQKIKYSKEETLQELEKILDSYSYLLESELVNDIIMLVSILRSEIYDFSDAVTKSVGFISESKKIIEKYSLINYMGILWASKGGEPPRIKLGKSGVYPPLQYRYYSEWLVESIDFRDEYSEKYQLKRMSERLKRKGKDS